MSGPTTSKPIESKPTASRRVAQGRRRRRAGRGPRARPSSPAHRSIALTHFEGRYGALDNRCPHQGGPLGEGSIENGLLRCPWHGWDYDPLTGKPPGGLDDGAETLRGRGARRRRLRRAVRRRAAHARTVVRRDGRDDGRLGRHPRLRHGRPLQPRARRRAAPRRGARRAHATSASATRAPPRSPRRPTASSPAGPPPASRSPARARPTCSPACGTPRSTARRSWPSPARSPRRCSGRGAFQEVDLAAAFADVAGYQPDGAARLRPRRAR